MKNQTLLILLAVLAFASCRKDNKVADTDERSLLAGVVSTPCTGAFGPIDLPDVIVGNRTLYNDTVYQLNGKTWVRNGILTIEPGTVIKGVVSTQPEDASALIITRTAQISAVGTPSCPIVFTSNQTSPAPGDWGGVVVLGDAAISTTSGTAAIEGIDPPSVPSGVDYTYGGTTVADNSGTMQYVRIEYAGAVIEEGNELNGLTLGGIGCGTTLDHIEVMYGADDGFEFFGGDVNAKYLVSLGNNDDQFDFDFGYRGNLQFLVAIIDPARVYASNNSNGIESDGGQVAGFETRPVISNLTIIGTEGCVESPVLLNGIRLRVNSFAVVRNSIIAGYPTGIRLESAATIASLDVTNTCGTSTAKTYLFDNVVQACTTCFATFTPHSSTSCVTPTAIELVSPFVSPVAGYFDATEALYPIGGPALGANFCGLTPVNCSFTFDVVDMKGGAVDPGGNYWLTEGWLSH